MPQSVAENMPPPGTSSSADAVVAVGNNYYGVVVQRVKRLGAFVALVDRSSGRRLTAKDGLIRATGASRSRRTVPPWLVSGCRIEVVVERIVLSAQSAALTTPPFDHDRTAAAVKPTDNDDGAEAGRIELVLVRRLPEQPSPR